MSRIALSALQPFQSGVCNVAIATWLLIHLAPAQPTTLGPVRVIAQANAAVVKLRRRLVQFIDNTASPLRSWLMQLTDGASRLGWLHLWFHPTKTYLRPDCRARRIAGSEPVLEDDLERHASRSALRGETLT